MKEINNFFKILFCCFFIFTTKVESKVISIGNANANITVKVFSSLTCPHCASFHKEVFNSLKLDYNNFNYAIYRTLVNNNSTIYNNKLTNIYNKYLLHNKYVSNDIKDFIKTEKNKNSSKLLIYKLPYKNTYIKYYVIPQIRNKLDNE